jgi:dienelactone hydrolase
VVLLHGCSGVQPNAVAWAVWLRAQGYAAFVLDSFGGRGLTRLCGDSAPLTGFARATDVYEAARYLRTLAPVDGTRVGAMGFSHGGWTLLWASAVGHLYPEVRLGALVALYPFCGDFSDYRSPVPLLMLLGGADDWTPAAPCERIAERARRSGREVTAVVYPGAPHAFDAATLTRPVFIADARRGAGATVAYDPRAHEDAERQVKRFLDARLMGVPR